MTVAQRDHFTVTSSQLKYIPLWCTADQSAWGSANSMAISCNLSIFYMIRVHWATEFETYFSITAWCLKRQMTRSSRRCFTDPLQRSHAGWLMHGLVLARVSLWLIAAACFVLCVVLFSRHSGTSACNDWPATCNEVPASCKLLPELVPGKLCAGFPWDRLLRSFWLSTEY